MNDYGFVFKMQAQDLMAMGKPQSKKVLSIEAKILINSKIRDINKYKKVVTNDKKSFEAFGFRLWAF